jgi:hypothetical protein
LLKRGHGQYLIIKTKKNASQAVNFCRDILSKGYARQRFKNLREKKSPAGANSNFKEDLAVEKNRGGSNQRKCHKTETFDCLMFEQWSKVA